MNTAIARKTLRDALPMLATAFLGMVLLELLFVWVISDLADDLRGIWLENAFLQRIINMLAGEDIAGQLNTNGFMAIGLGHPLVYACTWFHILATASRVIAGEIDRGTADLLLALPVSRARVYASVSGVLVLSGIPLTGAPLLGAWIGTNLVTLPEPLNFGRLSIVSTNYLALFVCISGVAMMASAWASRRGPVLAGVLAWLLLSFLLNFLSQFSDFFKLLNVIGALNYYRTLPIVRTGEWPVGDMIVLIILGAASWIVGLIVHSKRDIPAT